MKDEIKEILELFGSADENIMFGDIVELNSKQSHLLLDYITNLQEKLNKIDKLINTDYGWVSYYYKYNNRYLKSEIKEDINKILGGDDNE